VLHAIVLGGVTASFGRWMKRLLVPCFGRLSKKSSGAVKILGGEGFAGAIFLLMLFVGGFPAVVGGGGGGAMTFLRLFLGASSSDFTFGSTVAFWRLLS
jgi:hypothetical protein